MYSKATKTNPLAVDIFATQKANRRGGGRARRDPAPHGPTPARNVAGDKPGADPHALELITFYQMRPRAATDFRRLAGLRAAGFRPQATGFGSESDPSMVG